MLYIRELSPSLNVQSDSIKAKLWWSYRAVAINRVCISPNFLSSELLKKSSERELKYLKYLYNYILFSYHFHDVLSYFIRAKNGYILQKSEKKEGIIENYIKYFEILTNIDSPMPGYIDTH